MGATPETNTVKAEENDSNVSKTPWLVYILTFIGQMSLINVGYDLGASAGAILLAQDVDYLRLNQSWKQLIMAGAMPSAAISSPIGAFLSDRFGRRKGLMFACFCNMLGAVVTGLAPNRETLLIGRLLIGAGIGLTAAINGVYIAECSPSHVRGRLVGASQPIMTVGVIIGTVISALFSHHTDNGWRYIWGIQGVFSFIQFFGLIFLPESPRWFIQKSMKDEAKKSLIRIRDDENIEEEIKEIEDNFKALQESTEKKGGGNTLMRIFQIRSVRKALIVGCGMQVFAQFSGGNAFTYYSGIIIQMSGIGTVSDVLWNSVLVNLVSVVFAIFGVWLIDAAGRRKLAIVSLLGLCFSSLFLGTTFLMTARYSPRINTTSTNFLDSACSTYSQCDDCVRDADCGFCYEGIGDNTNGACLPVSNTPHLTSKVGACNSSLTLSENSMTWAYDYCPATFSWIAMIGLALFLMFYHSGIGPLPWTINPEIYPLWARSTCNGISSFTACLCLLITSASFLTLTEIIRSYGVFYAMSVIALIGAVFCYLFLPETKKKTLEEIEVLFASERATVC